MVHACHPYKESQLSHHRLKPSCKQEVVADGIIGDTPVAASKDLQNEVLSKMKIDRFSILA